MEIQELQQSKKILEKKLSVLITEFEVKTNTVVSNLQFTPSTTEELLIESSDNPVEVVHKLPVVKIQVSI